MRDRVEKGRDTLVAPSGAALCRGGRRPRRSACVSRTRSKGA